MTFDLIKIRFSFQINQEILPQALFTKTVYIHEKRELLKLSTDNGWFLFFRWWLSFVCLVWSKRVACHVNRLDRFRGWRLMRNLNRPKWNFSISLSFPVKIFSTISILSSIRKLIWKKYRWSYLLCLHFFQKFQKNFVLAYTFLIHQ